jgi:adenylylsulfate kinase
MSATTAITAFISPYIADRDIARKLHEEAGLPFLEVHSSGNLLRFRLIWFTGIRGSLAGKRREARSKRTVQEGTSRGDQGCVPQRSQTVCRLTRLNPQDFTGISAPYEAPKNPEIHINTDNTSVDDGVKQMVQYLQDKKYI